MARTCAAEAELVTLPGAKISEGREPALPRLRWFKDRGG